MKVFRYLWGLLFTQFLLLIHCEVGTTITIQCTKTIHAAAFGWRAYLSNGQTIFGTLLQNNLASLGVDLYYPNENVSIISFNATNNELQALECRFTSLSDGNEVVSSRTRIILYGPPQTPTSITVGRNRNVLTVNWTVPLIAGVSITFIVTLSKLQEESVELNDTQSYQFSIADKSCGAYEINVTASNLAGSSTSSTSGVYQRMIEDLCHEISLNDKGTILTVVFNVSKCKIDDEISFELEVFKSDDSKIYSDNTTTLCHFNNLTDNMYTCQRELLSTNTYYYFTITASNTFGIFQTDSTEISTHSVQRVTLANVNMNNTYNITCSFLAGTDTYGCKYTLTNRNNSMNISGIVIRSSGNIGSSEVVIPDIQNYSMVTAYEIDVNNRTVYTTYPFRSFNIYGQSLSVECKALVSLGMEDETSTENFNTPASTENFNTSSSQINTAVIVGSVVAALVGLALVLVLVIILFYIGIDYKKESKKILPSHLLNQGNNTMLISDDMSKNNTDSKETKKTFS